MVCTIVTTTILSYKALKTNSLPNILLSVIFFLITVSFSRALIIKHLLESVHFSTQFILYKTKYLSALPALFYIYIRMVLFDEKRFKTTDLWHALVFLSFMAVYSVPQNLEVLATNSNDINMNTLYWKTYFNINSPRVLTGFRIALSFIYLLFQFQLLFQYFKKEIASIQMKRVKKWLYLISYIKLGVLVFIILMVFILNPDTTELTKLNVRLVISIAFFLTSIYILGHPTLMLNIPKYIRQEKQKKGKPLKVTINNLFETMETDMQNNKPYLNSNFNITLFSAKINIPTKKITLTVIEKGFKNFSDYANSYRIKESTSLIESKFLETYNIDALAEASGFNATNTFYRCFKNIHKCTPKAYSISVLEENKKE